MMATLRGIFHLVFNRMTLVILALLLISAVIYLVGPLVAVAEFRPLSASWVRWTLIAGIWLLWLFWLLLGWWRSRNVNAMLLGQLAKMQSSERPVPGAAGREQVAELDKRFREATEILKKTRFAREGQGRTTSLFSRKYVYQLPWYAFIGAPGSGKTTALINAGLTFPLADQFGKAALRGVGGTRNCDWWFTNEAVLIDTAGRYTTQESNESVDKAEWQGFLKLLKKFRPRQPLNGVLLTVSVADLLQMTAQEREIHAGQLKSRLNDLREGLGVQFPVYVLVTKSDLLAGFHEYFLSLNREERAQVWGFTFPYDPRAPGVHGVQESFNTEFDLLYKRLNDGMQQCLLNEPDLTRRALAYTLPQQFAGMREMLGRLLGSVFSESNFAEQPMLRGVYFTSGTQEGAPFDRVLGAMERTFGVASRVGGSSMAGTGKSYFLTDLLQKVIFKEDFIAGRNLAAEQRLRWLRVIGIVTCVAVAVAANIAWWVSYRSNVAYIDEVGLRAEALRTAVAALPTTPSEDTAALLEVLEQADEVAHSSKFDPADPPLSYRWGLYQGEKLDSAGQTVYQKLLEGYFMARIATRLETLLRRAPPDRPEMIYQALKAYLMMFDAAHVDPKFVKAWLAADWRRTLPPDTPASTFARLARHLDRVLTSGAFVSPQPQNIDLVRQARSVLQQQSAAQRNYARIKSRLAGADLPDINVLSAAGDAASSVFVRASRKPLSSGVDGYFSVKGYNDFFKKELLASTAEIAREDAWVLGLQSTAPTVAIDAAELARTQTAITRIYLTEYARAWDDFVNDIRLRPAANLGETIQFGRVLGAPDSPLTMLVRTIARETTLIRTDTSDKTLVERGAEKLEKITREVDSALGSSGGSPGAPALRDDRPENIVMGPFRRLRELAAGSQGTAPIDSLAKTIQEYVLGLEASENSLRSGGTARAFEAEARLRSEAARMPTPVREIIEALTSDATTHTSQSVRTNAVGNVKGGVGQLCAAVIAGRYPFTRGAQNEVLPNDFAQIFAPGTGMDEYFQKNLAAYVDTSKAVWAPRPGPAGAGAGSANDLAQFQRARDIRDAFFASNGRMPGFEVEARVLAAAGEKVELDVDGQAVTALEGGKRITWPGPRKGNTVKLSVGNATPLVTEGNWALQRLIDRGRIQAGTPPERLIVSFNIDGKEVTLEFRSMSVRNPLRLPALQDFSCPGRGG